MPELSDYCSTFPLFYVLTMIVTQSYRSTTCCQRKLMAPLKAMKHYVSVFFFFLFIQGCRVVSSAVRSVGGLVAPSHGSQREWPLTLASNWHRQIAVRRQMSLWRLGTWGKWLHLWLRVLYSISMGPQRRPSGYWTWLLIRPCSSRRRRLSKRCSFPATEINNDKSQAAENGPSSDTDGPISHELMLPPIKSGMWHTRHSQWAPQWLWYRLALSGCDVAKFPDWTIFFWGGLWDFSQDDTTKKGGKFNHIFQDNFNSVEFRNSGWPSAWKRCCFISFWRCSWTIPWIRRRLGWVRLGSVMLG